MRSRPGGDRRGFCFLGVFAGGGERVEIVFGLALLGVGMGIFQTPNNNLLMSSVPRHRLGVGSSVLSIVRSLGYSVGAALAAAIVSAHLAAATGQTSLQFLSGGAREFMCRAFAAFMRGFHFACLAAAVLCFVGAAISAVRVSREHWSREINFLRHRARPINGSLRAGEESRCRSLSPGD